MLVQGSKLHTPPGNYHLLTAQQEPYIDHIKKPTSEPNIFKNLRGKKSQNGPLALSCSRKRKEHQVTGLGTRTRGERVALE